MNGYEVAKAIRSDPTLRQTRLVALSGYAQPEDLERVRQAGFDGHISKPPAMDKLQQLLSGDRGRAGGVS